MSSKQKAKSSKPATKALKPAEIKLKLKMLSGWSLEDGAIQKKFSFENFYETMSFVNAVAWIANQADHHPDMTVGYNKCVVRYSTHSVGGISEKDFQSASEVEALQV